jgi:hypothetical protein
MGNLCIFPSIIDKRTVPDQNKLLFDEEKAHFKNKGERLEINFDSDSTRNQKVTLSDFKKIRVLGIGAFGRVILVKRKNTSKF